MQALPIGISEFTELRQKKRLYVDKTRHAYLLLQSMERTFLSRPRRFGKSLFVSTLEAILQGKKELFDGLWIGRSDYSWVPYGVIRLDFSALDSRTPEALEKSFYHFLLRIAKEYEVSVPSHFIGVKHALETVTTALFDRFGRVAILIDEYDYPILHALHTPSLAMDIRSVIRDFSTAIKALQKEIQFVFVTGVSAFSKSGLSSGLNNLLNLTMLPEFFDICGYTEEEIEQYFKEYVQVFAEKKGVSFLEAKELLRAWYNGYCFKEGTSTVYSPFSFTNALHIKEIKNFWFESSTPKFLLEELKKEERKKESAFLEISMLKGTEDLLQTFEVEDLPLVALLFQMGYLTLDSYNPLSRNYTLRYPNLEVKAALHRHLLALLANKSVSSVNPLVGEIYRALAERDRELFLSVLRIFLSEIPYSLHIPEEKFYHSLLQVLFSAAGIVVQSERLTASGRMDMSLELQNCLYIVEFKLKDSASSAVRQIVEKKYYEPLLHKKKPVWALGLSFSKGKKGKVFQIEYAMQEICA